MSFRNFVLRIGGWRWQQLIVSEVDDEHTIDGGVYRYTFETRPWWPRKRVVDRQLVDAAPDREERLRGDSWM